MRLGSGVVMKQPALALVILAAALPTAAQGLAQGRIRHAEGGTTLQRASEAGSEEAARNMPYLPGDRVWTDDSGRVEFQFGGSRVRLDIRSKLDYLAQQDNRGGERVLLRLWSGSLVVRGNGERGPGFAIETPGGVVEVRGGVVRVDVVTGEARVSVLEGEASLDNGRQSVRLEAGERTFAANGEDPERPERFDRREADAFTLWDSDREGHVDWASGEARYLPEEVAPYASELEGNGSWHFDVQLGYVWRPYVGAGWRPYQAGRWAWSAHGWTWVASEPWGWAPFHYGRWGHSAQLGFYWIPGRTWGPAWVSWSAGGDYVGWCALGHGDRPLRVADARVTGYAVPRGAERASPWVYARRGDLTARDLARRRVELTESEASAVRVVERNAHVDRAARIAEGESAVPRSFRTRPTPAGTAQEPGADPAATIPSPSARRFAAEDARRERGASGRARAVFEQAATASSSPAPADGDEQARRRREAAETPAPQPESEAGAARPRGAGFQGGSGDRNADREVLRRLFTPLSGARSHDRSEAGESRPQVEEGEKARARTRETPRDTPRAERPPRPERSQPPSSEESKGSARRKKEQER